MAEEIQPGYVENGYRFTGGDAGDKKNWVNIETGKTEAEEEAEAAQDGDEAEEEED